MAVTEKNIVLCGHGSGTPSTKVMSDYLTYRYSRKAPNGKDTGVVAVMRLKALTDSGRTKFHDKYKTILGRNGYNQGLRSYVYSAYKGKYYSDCSSSGCATFKAIGYNVPLLNTAGIYQSSLFTEVKVNIKNGHITNPEVLKVGDCILFRGSDPLRPKQIGHVEYVYEIKGSSDKKEDSVKDAGSSATSKYFKACASKYTSLTDALESIGAKSDATYRGKIAKANGISNYTKSAEQNAKLLELLKKGKLIKP